jgi:DNA-binding CsgD family transcriptional regulator
MDHRQRARIDSWMDLVLDLLSQPLTAFPHEVLNDQFASTIEATPAWHWVNPDGTFGFSMLNQPCGWPTDGELRFWQEQGLHRHPLVRWFLVTGDWSPQTMSRVPVALEGRLDPATMRSWLGPAGLDEQLSIPLRPGAPLESAFILARTGGDFTTRELELARVIQPMLAALERQCRVLDKAHSCTFAAEGGTLTGRELAVLDLVAHGLTAQAVAHRLGGSPRTMEKHLEHVYRKLGVRDRLVAVQVAQQQGLLHCDPLSCMHASATRPYCAGPTSSVRSRSSTYSGASTPVPA